MRAVAIILLWVALTAAGPPPASLEYKEDLVLEARAVWGFSAPIAAFAGQIQQESRWNPNAHSAFAAGLTQFTPGTATWIAGLYSAKLGTANIYNPQWAIRAQMLYMKRLWDGVSRFNNDCSRIQFAFSDYNGGTGWRMKRQARSPQPGNYAVTSRINPGIRPQFQIENQSYPFKIIFQHQKLYASWGGKMMCGVTGVGGLP